MAKNLEGELARLTRVVRRRLALAPQADAPTRRFVDSFTIQRLARLWKRATTFVRRGLGRAPR